MLFCYSSENDMQSILPFYSAHDTQTASFDVFIFCDNLIKEEIHLQL